MDGTKIPQGTLHPYERTISATRTIVARRSELTICHCADVLWPFSQGVSEDGDLTGKGLHCHHRPRTLGKGYPSFLSYRFEETD